MIFVFHLFSLLGLLYVMYSKLDSVNKKVHFSPQVQRDTWQNHSQARPRIPPSGNWYF